MARKTRVISVRLHDSGIEGDALSILDNLESGQYTRREIITDALLRLSGIVPTMYEDNIITTHTLEAILDTKFKQMQRDLLSEFVKHLKSNNVSFGNDNSQPVADDDDFANNLISSFFSRGD